ncbi:hypothetical protein [Runella salmonicolor]|uniref:Uncharacterized protein n=1 Tax=Runella salmonicolor TaxID=2950278 RepID=A0ABT1FJD1_9BACT|nr:hypothetical protein [Runella salmonicolor]MCP1380878.1 hypothetical protein [Runella salmonicolor]
MASPLSPAIEKSSDYQRVSSTDFLLGIPPYLYAVVFSSFCVIVGLIWDICWHLSIGRDGLFSPPHVIIYVGAIVSGLFSGYQVLYTTFKGSVVEKAQSVKVWGFFYSSLGALFCIWGALMMLTSAPFDDWWHGTYGLDVQILSPPHTVLALGIIGVQFGAIVSVLAVKNQMTGAQPTNTDFTKRRFRRLNMLFALSAGFLVTMWFTLLSEEIGKWEMHNSSFYKVSAMAFPLVLLAFGRGAGGRWTITSVTGVYTAVMCLTLWIIPLFPAEPKLGPIWNHIDHYQGFAFPLLLIVPALAMDWILNRYTYINDWVMAAIMSVVFVVITLIVQWPFGSFLQESPYARNWFFGSHYYYFGNDPDWEYRYKYAPWVLQNATDFSIGIAYALGFGYISSRIGLAWGKWMRKIQR